MGTRVTLTRAGDVAVVTIDNPPVNALGPGVPEGLARAIAEVAADPALRAAVIAGAGRSFVAGADIREFGRITSGARPAVLDLAPLFSTIEECPKPVVAALHGTAFGGGLELAMACHYRVALPDAQLGQPEVKLGLIPGAGGTQRLPRLAGVERALRMCTEGDPIAAPAALADGLVDRIVDGDLLAGAVALACERLASGEPPRRTRDLTAKLGTPGANLLLFQAARQSVRRKGRGLPAPLAAIEAIEAATRLPFDEGCSREAELFRACLFSDTSKALIHVFFGEREVGKVPGVTRDTPVVEVHRAAVVGAGALGAGIAMACAGAGIPVLLAADEPTGPERATAAIRAQYAAAVERGRLSRQAADACLARIQPAPSVAAFDAVDIAVEAAVEDLEVKRRVLAALDHACPPHVLLASSTAALDLDALAGATGRPDRVVGLHFVAPPDRTRLLEIVRGRATSAATLASSLALARRLRKVGVVVGNGPGFAGNRMHDAYLREARLLVAEGAEPAEVDAALVEFGMATGPLETGDLSGRDGAGPILGERSRPEPRRLDAPEIVERSVYALVNEAARILEEGIALRSVDLDVIAIHGYGFPAHRGGPLWYADTVGLGRVLDRMRELERRHGGRWAPAPLIERLARARERFASVGS